MTVIAPTVDPVADAQRHQMTAADPALTVFVTANAGSGKTSTLVSRVARLLLKRVKPEEILCVTYTKAAAAEMQGRLFDRLGQWAVADDRKLAEQLAELDARDPASLTDAELSDARVLFARALETPGGLKIQTIHAFCEKLLRRFPLEAGVQPGFEVLEDQAAIALSQAARDDLARLALRDPHGTLGRAYNHFAVELAFDAFHSLLGTLEARRESLLDYLDRIDAGIAPAPRTLLGVGPDETAKDIEQAFLDWLSPGDWISAADGFAISSAAGDKKLAEQMRANVPPATSVDALYSLFFDSKDKAREKFGTAKAPADASNYLMDVSLKYLATRDRMLAVRIAEETEHALALARVHSALYEAAKAERGMLDFGDLVTRTRALLTERSSAAWVLFKLDGGIEHVLIDEAQDTAPEQWAIMRALTEPFFAGDGAERRDRIARTVFAVGDEKQSIYSFQGARPEQLREERGTYLNLTTEAGLAFEGPDLNTSFRSTEAVLAFVDQVFDSPGRTRALVGETGDIKPHLPARQGQAGSVELWPLFTDPATPEPEAWNAPVDKEDSRSARKQLAQALAREIRRQVEDGAPVWTTGKDRKPEYRPARYGDFLVLVRRRDGTFEEIIRALKTEGVPVAGADRLKLNAHIVFDDLMALARFAQFPDDDLSLAEVLKSPFCALPDFDGADALYPLADSEARAGRTLWKALRDRAAEQPLWTAALEFLSRLIAVRDRDPFTFFSTALNHVGPDGRSGRAKVLERLGREAEEAIDETLTQVMAAEARGGRDLETCLALLEQAEVEVKREMEGTRNEVRVMTVHGSKGLEAPIVILPDTTSKAKPQGPSLLAHTLADGQTAWIMAPSAKANDSLVSAEARQARIDRTDAESLRLLYVALTRARDRLIIMGRGLSNRKEGFEEGSWWDVLTGTFAALDEQGLVTHLPALDDQMGQRLRYGTLADAIGKDARREAGAVDLPAWVRQAPPADAAARFAAPSRMEGGAARIPAPSPLARAGTGGAALGRFRRGDLIHRLLERLPDIAPDGRRAAAAQMLKRERDLDDTQRAEMIDAAFRVLEDDRFAPVFGPGSRAEVALTGTAPELPKGVSINGQIDRLVVTPERVLVIDYKTNRPAPDTLEGVDPAYVLQLAVYAAVLRKLYPDRPVEAALVWTDGPKLTPVPEAVLRAALTAPPRV